ncbi:MAG: heparinase II/III family protein [Terracidiphilus sp.]|nr:heparinase II/III family protein [Terracidiphilus sp.]
MRLYPVLLHSALASLAVLTVAAFAAQTLPAQALPHLLLDKSDFVRLNQLAKDQPWAAKQRQAILDQADAFPASYEKRYGLASFELPPEGGQWMHYYACPDTGSPLRFEPPDRHVCPDTGKVFKGYPYDHCVYQMRADDLEKEAITEALAFRLTGKREYAEKGAMILKAYADKYLSYPMHDNYGKESQFGARVYSQTLDEAIWLIDLSWTYDLLRDTDMFTPAERTHIERDLLYASAMTVTRANNGPTPNIQTWILGAEMAVGYTIGDSVLVSKALDGARGFRSQMKEYVNDGFWFEGAWGYQFYMLRPTLFMALMSTRAGVDLWKQETNIAALFASPIGVMYPNGELPGFNDSHEVDLAEQAYLYEAAYGATDNPAFASIAARGKRENRFAYLFGAPTLDKAAMPALKSAVFPEAGYATLRAPAGDLTEIVKFGPHGGGHGHFDKLNELIYAEGGMMGVDPGTHFYGIPIHGAWDKQTVAHNTVSVDEHDQKPATGKLLAWQAEADFTAVRADAGPIYDGVTVERSSILTSDYVVEITRAKSTDGKAHDFDWNYHNFGTQAAEGEFKPYTGFPARDGYQMLTENKTATLAGDFRTTFTMDKGRTMRVWMPGGEGASQVFTGFGPGPDLRVKIPYAIVRRHGTEAEFVAVFEPSVTSTLKIQSFTRNGNTFKIRGAVFEDTIELGEKVAYRHVALP